VYNIVLFVYYGIMETADAHAQAGRKNMYTKTTRSPTSSPADILTITGMILVVAGMFVAWFASPIPTTQNLGNLDEHVITLPEMVITP